jgi:recombination protein RecR
MGKIQELALLLAELPGIGPRQARRIVQFFLSKNPAYREKFAAAVAGVGAGVSQCSLCFRYHDDGTKTLCRICADANRDTSLLMVVEKDVDIDGMEAAGAYKGLYFVLGNLIPMTERKNAPIVRTKEFISRVSKNAVSEIIFGLATTPEGDYTARELSKETNAKYPNIKTSLLGRGLSVGAEIEYADTETLRNALKNRA